MKNIGFTIVTDRFHNLLTFNGKIQIKGYIKSYYKRSTTFIICKILKHKYPKSEKDFQQCVRCQTHKNPISLKIFNMDEFD